MANIILYALILIVVIVRKVKGNILSFIQHLLAYYDFVLCAHDTKNMLRKEFTTKEDWLEDIFTNSNTKASLKSAETIVLSVSKSLNYGFICFKCFSDKRNSSKKYYRTEGQIKYFLRDLKS